MKESKHEFDIDVENHICSILTEEVETGRTNRTSDNDEYEMIVNMFEGQRPVKDYEWYSNLSLKEGTSILLTDTSTAVNQYFQTRDFVEVRLEGDDENDLPKSRAAKKCVNKMLNNRRLHHYLKFTKSKNINNMASHVYAICEWEQNVENRVVGYNTNWVESGDVDADGGIIWMPQQEEVTDEVIKKDHFNYDVYDPRNVFVSDEYTYSIQDKKWIIFRSEQCYDDLRALAGRNGYINLDSVKELNKPDETETEKASYNKHKTKNKAKKTPIKNLDLYVRFGKMWAIVEERQDHNPSKVKPGWDKDGNVLEDAELVEAITAYVKSGTNTVLIRFDATPFIDSRGNPYRPILRGLCYPHPTKDTGLGEGSLLLDLNAGIDDSFNLGFDRAKLATIPTMVAEKFAAQDNDTLFIEPGHTMEIEGGKKAIEMFEIDSDLQGILAMNGLIQSKAQQVTSTYPSTMGNAAALPASTTATAIAGAEQRSNLRQNYKSITFEYTFLTEFYWMILQMTWRFAKPKTRKKLMGEDAYFFDPDADYTYTPVTSAIETEYNKFRKMDIINGVMQTVGNVKNKNTPKVLNVLTEMLFEVLGPDFMRLQKVKFDESAQSQLAAMQGGKGDGSQAMIEAPMSNQSGNPMSTGEMGAREAMYQ